MGVIFIPVLITIVGLFWVTYVTAKKPQNSSIEHYWREIVWIYVSMCAWIAWVIFMLFK